MRYCGVVGAGPYLQLVTLEEVRTEEPPIRLHARFYEPGSPEAVVREIRAFGEVVLGIGAALSSGPRMAGEELRRRGVSPLAPHDGAEAIVHALRALDREHDREQHEPAGDGRVEHRSPHPLRRPARRRARRGA